MDAGDHALKRGSNILAEKPFVHILHLTQKGKRCDFCFKQVKVLKCSACKNVYYCTRKCQMNDWILHKLECKFLQSEHPQKVLDAPRMLSRIIIKLHIGGDNEKGYYTENCFRKFKDLLCHYDEIKVDKQKMKKFEWLKALLKGLLEDRFMPNSAGLFHIYGRMLTNCFTIMDEEMNPIGAGLYLGASIIDHSCKPNAVQIFEGTTLHIRAIEDIPCLDFKKIFISYVDVLNFKEDRRAELKKTYFFLCECPRCLNDDETRESMAAACPNKKCSEPVNIEDEKCGTCATEITKFHREEYQDIIHFTKIRLEILKNVFDLELSKVCLAKQKNILHPLNMLHVRVLYYAFEGALNVELWDEAIVYGKELIAGFRKYFGDWSPMLAVHYMKIARAQSMRNLLEASDSNCLLQAQDSVKNMIEAKKILKVTHGDEHSIYKENLRLHFLIPTKP